jgi:hypothetical protein
LYSDFAYDYVEKFSEYPDENLIENNENRKGNDYNYDEVRHEKLKIKYKSKLGNKKRPFHYVPAPIVFEDIPRKMKTAAFWISKIEDPNKIILTKEEILNLNKKTFSKGVFLTDVFNISFDFYKKRSTKTVKQYFQIFAKYYTGTSTKPINKKLLNKIEEKIDYDSFESAKKNLYAITISHSEMRLLPTNIHLYSALDSFGVDKVQQTHLDLGSPVAILGHTKDKSWYYAVSEIAEGWINSDSLAFGRKEEIKNYRMTKKTKCAVVISANADIYNDKKMTKFIENVRLGTLIQVSNVGRKMTELVIPTVNENKKLIFKKAYIHSEDIAVDFLPYTQKNIIKQAFKLLYTPYGWGDIYGYTDCSGFLRQLYLSFGIVLPRNSSAQMTLTKEPLKLKSEDNCQERDSKIIENAIPGITFLQFPGHIMLYLGEYNDKPYVIHAIWGYGGQFPEQYDKVFLINKVVVSTLMVGERSEKGPLLKRLTTVGSMKK